MEKTNEISIWVESFRPNKFSDIIAPSKLQNFLKNLKKDGDIPNLIFDGPAGTGKTTTAIAIAKELGTTYLHLNCSINTGINDIREEVQNFATTKSLFSDGIKIAILDEFDRLSGPAMDSLKGLIEQTAKNCRYIFITNHIQKVIPPLISRCQQFTFGINESEKKELILQYFKRSQDILNQENIPYDKKILGKFIKELYPDFRKILNELQKCAKSHGEINDEIFNYLDDGVIKDLIAELKSMKFNNMRKIATSIDPSAFYKTFYDDITKYLENSCIPDIIVLLAEFCYRDGISIDREINLVACLVEIMKSAVWKK